MTPSRQQIDQLGKAMRALPGGSDDPVESSGRDLEAAKASLERARQALGAAHLDGNAAAQASTVAAHASARQLVTTLQAKLEAAQERAAASTAERVAQDRRELVAARLEALKGIHAAARKAIKARDAYIDAMADACGAINEGGAILADSTRTQLGLANHFVIPDFWTALRAAGVTVPGMGFGHMAPDTPSWLDRLPGLEHAEATR